MTFTKKLIASSVTAAVVSAASFAPVANAEVSASVGVANMYLWRGENLGAGGPGTPAVSGSIDYGVSGFYAGVWGSSGDATNGTEYDIYYGYGGSVGDFSYDVSAWTYNYPTAAAFNAGVDEVAIGLGYGPVSLGYITARKSPDEGDRYAYLTLGVEFGAFSATYGMDNTGEDAVADKEHIDLSYAYNDNVSFTVSTRIDDNEGVSNSPLFVVSYSMPIE